MNPFSYRRAYDFDGALALVQGVDRAAFIAGGTTLLDLMKEGVERPAMLIDINHLAEAREVADEGPNLRIGALVRNSDLAQDERVRARWPLLSQALLAGASAQLRNMATVGGNLMQRTRCPYFRDVVFNCNKRQPGTGCSALDGYNRGHAILGTSEHCIATHPSDMLVALVAFGGDVRVIGDQGARDIPFAEFHRLPAATPHIETALRPGELIESVRLEAPPSNARMIYLKVRDRASYEFALTSAGIILSVEDNRILAARVVLGGVATVPWRSALAEDALVNQEPSRGAFERAAEIAFATAQPRAHNAFKIELGRRTLVRALEQAMEAA